MTSFLCAPHLLLVWSPLESSSLRADGQSSLSGWLPATSQEVEVGVGGVQRGKGDFTELG